MKHDFDHFLAQAHQCVPHLSPDDKLAWAIHCHDTHPGHNDEPLTPQQTLSVIPPPLELPRWLKPLLIGILVSSVTLNLEILLGVHR